LAYRDVGSHTPGGRIEEDAMTQSEIEVETRLALPAIFNREERVGSKAVRTKLAELNAYATTVSGAYLQPDTIRSQTLLVSLSAFLVVVAFFRIGDIKVLAGARDVRADQNFFIVATVLLVAMAGVFLLKAYVDVQRARFTRERDQALLVQTQALIVDGAVERQFSEYCLQQLSDAVVRARAKYDDAIAIVSGGGSGMKATTLDLKRPAAVGNDSMMATHFAIVERRVEALNDELTRDEARFRRAADDVLGPSRSEDPDEPSPRRDDRYEALEGYYEQSIGPWVKAYAVLANDSLAIAIQGLPELPHLDAMVAMLSRMVKIRRIYASLEIAAPIMFAVVALGYTWYELLRRTQP
jgi:hypothetical protein